VYSGFTLRRKPVYFCTYCSMAHKANQNKTALKAEKKPEEKQTAEPVDRLSETKLVDMAEAEFPNSLNEELDVLLKKNPRRFFGGCGG
jgi:hypothetical protein